MKLYDLAGSPNTRRTRIFIAEKGLDIDIIPIDMMKNENASPDYLSKNSLGKMPVLELDDGTCISESVAICRYLDEVHPVPPLFGEGALERAQVEMWNRRMELDLLIPTMQYFVNTHEMWQGRRQQVPEWGEVCKAQVVEKFTWLESELDGRAYLAGDNYTVADITAQCAVLMAKAVVGVRITDEQPNLTGWWERVSSRPTARV